MTSSETLKHSFIDSPINPSLQERLTSLYRCPFSLREYFEHFKRCTGYKTLVVESSGEIVHILNYQKHRKTITILNELLDISEVHLNYVLKALFQEHNNVNKILLNRARGGAPVISLPSRVVSSGNDVVIHFPDTIDKYHAKLSKRTRQNLKYYMNRINRTFVDFEFKVISSAAITQELIGRIVEMNRSRMKGKGIKSAVNHEYERGVAKLAAKCGLAATIHLDGELVAGTICYDLGSHCFGEIIAHDDRYSRFDVGQLCMYLTFNHLIERGTSYFHTLDGNNPYKYRYLGVNHELTSLSIYKSNKYKWYYATDLLAPHYRKIATHLHYYHHKSRHILLSHWRKLGSQLFEGRLLTSR